MTAVDWHLLQKGDKVVLNSGGPVMTMEDWIGDCAVCCWGNTQATRSLFDYRTIKKAEESDEIPLWLRQ